MTNFDTYRNAIDLDEVINTDEIQMALMELIMEKAPIDIIMGDDNTHWEYDDKEYPTALQAFLSVLIPRSIVTVSRTEDSITYHIVQDITRKLP